MESLARPVSFARALLALSRARQSGVLHVHSELGVCRIAIADGVPRAASSARGTGRALGDALLADGALDPAAHARAVEQQTAPAAPVGGWLVASGLTTRPALEVALRCQLRERVLRLFECRALEYRFVPGAADAGVPWLEEPMSAEQLVLIALRALAARVPVARITRVIPAHELELNSAGRQLTERVALWPDEAVASALLRRGATLHAIARATGGSERALRLCGLLALLSALRVRRVPDGDYALLLRKRAQVRGQGTAHALLDLPRDAEPAQARRALRRLAARVHPDRLAAGAAPSLRRASSEVMSALIEAERELRAEDRVSR
jgi:hypothetical protein